MAKEIDSQQTKRAMAFELWMSAPNPKVTFFKTLDVTPLVRISKKKNLKFKGFRSQGSNFRLGGVAP